jgi:predicted dehydrogenase/threonine dehydrogenase-like Zn-dependent dehydrogenase
MGQLSVVEVPPPEVRAGQVIVRSAFSLISAGTERSKIETGRKSLLGKALARPDQVQQVLASYKQAGLQATLQRVRTRLDSRSPLGYSASGVVLEVGDGVIDIRPGDAVACGGTSAAHAEIIAVPKNLCVVVPSGVALDDAAFTTVGAIALQGIRQADLQLGECAVVLGLGLLGQLAVQMLKASGCTVIGFDPNEGRCALASQLGADAVATSESALTGALSLNKGKGADAVLITAGTPSNQPVELAGRISRDKGRVVVVGAVGLKIPRAPYYEKELDVRLSRSYGPGRYDPKYEEQGIDYPYGYVRWTEARNMEAFLSLLARGSVKVQPLITHKFGLAQAAAAYELIGGKTKEPYIGVLFEYDRAAPLEAGTIQITARKPAAQGQVSVGVIGAGNFAQSMLLPHLRANRDAVLAAVATADPLQTRDVAERFGFSYAARGAEALLQEDAIRAVLIATRHDSHAELLMQALRAGKAVHIEKPLALNADELAAIQKTYAERPDAFVMVGFNRRFAPLVQEMKKHFAGRHEALAMTYRINAGYIPAEHWTQDPKQGGGRVIGEVCHFIDLLQFMAGAPISTVYACALPNQGKYCNDNVAITLRFGDGSAGNLLYVADGDKTLPKEYLEVHGEGRSAVLDDFRRLTLIAGGKTRVRSGGNQDKGHRQEMAAWIEAIRTGQPEPVPFAEAVRATAATFAVNQSLSSNAVLQLS